jgi:hypothetical protein
MDPIFPSCSWDSDEETKQKQKKRSRTAAILEDQEWKHQEYWETSKAEQGHCNKVTQSGPLTHNQSHQAQHTAERTKVKQTKSGTKEEIQEVIWCYMYCRQHFTEKYKKLYEIWRRHNPECRIYMDA